MLCNDKHVITHHDNDNVMIVDNHVMIDDTHVRDSVMIDAMR